MTGYGLEKTTWNKLTFIVYSLHFKVKLSPKSNQGIICDWIWVKPLCKCIITMKEALFRFTIVLFSGKLIFNGVQGHFYASIKIAIFKTLRRLDTTWNFARSITRVSTHEHEHWEHYLCTQSLLKRRFLNYSLLELYLRHAAVKASVDPWVRPNRQESNGGPPTC